jgi:hypothetical protein
MKRCTPTLLLLVAMGGGCAQIEDMRLKSQQRRLAYSSWAGAGGSYCHVAHSVDFQKGYVDGYTDVASGGDGCPPALPPKKYWGAAYQTPNGREHVKAWFAGFREGAEAAKRDGVESFSQIYVSPEHRRPNMAPGYQGQPMPSAVGSMEVPTPPPMQPVPQAPVQAPVNNAPAIKPPIGSQNPDKPMSITPPRLNPPPAPTPMATERPKVPEIPNSNLPQANAGSLSPPAPVWPTTAPLSSTEQQPKPPAAVGSSMPTTQAKLEKALTKDPLPIVPSKDVLTPPALSDEKAPLTWKPAYPVRDVSKAPSPEPKREMLADTLAKPSPVVTPKDSTGTSSMPSKMPPPSNSGMDVVQRTAATGSSKIESKADESKKVPAAHTVVPAFVQPLPDLPAGFVPEVIMGPPVKLNADGTISK